MAIAPFKEQAMRNGYGMAIGGWSLALVGWAHATLAYYRMTSGSQDGWPPLMILSGLLVVQSAVMLVMSIHGFLRSPK